MKRIVIAGGGISGLALAHRLTELKRQRSADLEVTLLEARDRFGGLIQTRFRSRFLLEAGPDAFLTEKPWASDLCWRLGIGQDLIETNSRFRSSAIVSGGRLVPVPEGWHLMAPAALGPLMKSPFLSFSGKLRMACERFVPVADAASDESVAQFVRRRFGQEALERIAEPMVGGIYTGDLSRLSLKAALPRFRELEQQYGSVTRGLQANGNGMRASGPRYGLFVSLREGMEQMVKALIARTAPNAVLKNGAEVIQVQFKNNEWEIALKNGETMAADHLCLALPSYAVARLIRPLDPGLSSELDQIRYASVATVNLAFSRKDVPHPLNMFGFVVPPREKRRIIGCSFSSVKLPDRSPPDSVLLRVFVGGALDPDAVQMEDGDLELLVRNELKDLLGIVAYPLLTEISRFWEAMPQYEVGHLQRVERIERMAACWPGLSLLGNAYRGVGIPDCIHRAEQLAERIGSAFSSAV